MPYEKFPVTGSQFPPLKSVTRMEVPSKLPKPPFISPVKGDFISSSFTGEIEGGYSLLRTKRYTCVTSSSRQTTRLSEKLRLR